MKPPLGRAAGASAAATALLLFATAFGPSEPAAASDTVSQIQLIAAADQLSPAIAGTTGLAGITVDPSAGMLRVYWKGDPPLAVRRAIAVQRRTVPISLIQAPYSEQELIAAGDAILPQDVVSGVAPAPDGSALLVSVTGDTESARALPAIQTAAVPIVIEPYEQPILADGGRQQDTAPYAGGSIYHFPLPDNSTGVCTTGFALQVGADRRMLSAAHCGADGDTFYQGDGTGSNAVLGTVSGSDRAHDTLLVDIDSTGAIYPGPFNAASTVPVHLAINNYPGTLVCTSAAVTGQHCDLRIVNVHQAIKVLDPDLGTYTITDEVRAEQISHTVAAGLGDSGGPVVAEDSPGNFQLVYPLGTVTAIDASTTVPCGATALATQCGWRVYYADLSAALVRYSATVVTG